jgi:predicted metalloprotease
VLRSTEDVWSEQLAQAAQHPYKKPPLVMFSGATRSGCGSAQSAMGPFYCPLDNQGLSRHLVLRRDEDQAARRR